MKKIITLIVSAICAVTVLSGCSQKSVQESYAPYGYEALTGCWVSEYEEDGRNCCDGIQFFSDGKCILRYTQDNFKRCDSLFYEYYTEKDGIIRVGEKMFHYSLTNDTLTLTNEEETREYKLWDKDINYLKELCPYSE